VSCILKSADIQAEITYRYVKYPFKPVDFIRDAEYITSESLMPECTRLVISTCYRDDGENMLEPVHRIEVVRNDDVQLVGSMSSKDSRTFVCYRIDENALRSLWTPSKCIESDIPGRILCYNCTTGLCLLLC
jgi:hypothetical protein